MKSGSLKPKIGLKQVKQQRGPFVAFQARLCTYIDVYMNTYANMSCMYVYIFIYCVHMYIYIYIHIHAVSDCQNMAL